MQKTAVRSDGEQQQRRASAETLERSDGDTALVSHGDSRPEAVAQRRLEALANRSAQARTTAALQRTLNTAPGASAAQRRPAAPGSGLPILQMRKLTDADVRTWVTWAAKKAQPNKQALCLAIYNQLRLSIDPAPAEYNALAAAKQSLTAGHQIDDDDATEIEAQAARMQQVGGDPAAFVRLRVREIIDAKYNAVEAKYGHHIFQGDDNNGTPTGFHSKADGSATHEAYGSVTDVGNAGAYQQSVRFSAGAKTKKPIQSTFFPDAATHAQVIEAIASVYEAGLSTVGHVHDNVNGMKLTKRGDTVFPDGGSNALLAE